MIFELIKYSHILAGVVSLVAAPIALVVVKGGTMHRVWGKIFFWCMTWIFISTLVMTIHQWNPFLCMIGVFSYYSAFIGYRSIFQKRLHKDQRALWYDWLALSITGLCMLVFIGWGALLSLKHGAAFGFLAIIFGSGGILLVISRIRAFLKPSAEPKAWLFNHIGSMMGAFIASITAFSVNVLTFMPGLLQWLWPTLVGTPFIIYFIRKNRLQTQG